MTSRVYSIIYPQFQCRTQNNQTNTCQWYFGINSQQNLFYLLKTQKVVLRCMCLFGSIHDAGVEREQYSWYFILRIFYVFSKTAKDFRNIVRSSYKNVICLPISSFFNIEQMRTFKHRCQIFMKNILRYLKCVPLKAISLLIVVQPSGNHE